MTEQHAAFESLTPPVRHGTIPWSVRGFLQARQVVRAARAGKLQLATEAAGLPDDLLAEAEAEDLAMGLWLLRQHAHAPPEVPAAHHIRFHAIEEFLQRHADLLLDEGLIRQGDDDDIESDPLLLSELVARPYDAALTTRQTPGFDAVGVLKAVSRRARSKRKREG